MSSTPMPPRALPPPSPSGPAAAERSLELIGENIDLEVDLHPGPGAVHADPGARSLRARQPGLRVVYTSGCAQDSARLLSDLEPGSRFLSKPFHPTALTRLVGELLAEGAGPSEEEPSLGTPTSEEESA